ncbi:MAG TPA: hypothetical protein VHG89_00760 [Verrucomicrobiae bacterium]|nr:hypothetical protein [Verrucomicrobiae bacterium]
MKKHICILISAILCAGLIPAYSQMGGQSGPEFNAALRQLFGDNQNFSAVVEVQTTDEGGNAFSAPGTMSFNSGKTRFDMKLSDMQSKQLNPQAIAQMKAMGMDQIVTITRPDEKVTYLVYPGMESYAQIATPNADTGKTNNFKMETTKLGQETVDGHVCDKNKVVITDSKGEKHESTTWNATDLKNFPVKIQTTEAGHDIAMLFKNVSLAKPDSSLFDPPAGFTKYDNVQEMMRAQFMKKMGGGQPPSSNH